MNKLISKYWLALVALVSVCMFSACSSDDDAVTPVFPQVQTIAGAAGDVKEFTFDANESWSLSSNKIWCKIAQNDAEKGFVINGTAGKQTVKVTLTDDDASKDLSVAQLNLKMGGQEVTIAEIHRSAAGYELKVYVRTSPDADPIDITETGIEAGYNKYSKFYVESNFRFAVTNTPEWVELEGGFMVGVPNKQVAGGVMFKEGVKNAKYAIDKSEGESITFASQDGKAEVTIPVYYNGMASDDINIEHPTKTPWAVWTVSLDGKLFTQNSSNLTGESSNDFTYHDYLPFPIKVLNDDIQLVVFEKDDKGLKENQTGAVQLKGEKGNMKLTVAPLTSGSRKFVAYALPKAVYESLENGLDDMLDNNFTEVKTDYDRYFLLELEQKENKAEAGDESAAPIIKLMKNYLDVACTKDVNGMYKEVASSFLNYNGDEIYVASAEVGSSLTVNPNIKNWDPTTMMETGYLYMIGSDGQKIVPEPNMDENNNWIFSFRLPETAPVFMAFQDNGKVVKVLVVEPTYNKSKKHTSIRKIRK